MADERGIVARQCEWCGENFHELPDDDHSQAPRSIYIDGNGNQFCEKYCRAMYNGAWNNQKAKVVNK